jgi:diguanylate cyclase
MALKTGKLALLQKASLFSTLRESELRTISRYSGLLEVPAGGEVFPEGSEVAEMFIIREGSVAIRSGSREVARFVSGEVFAETDLLDAAPRAVSAVAEAPSSVLVFPARGLVFRDLLEKHPVVFAHVLQKLLGVVAGRIRATDKLISEKSPWIQELKKQLLRDKLTGLYNRTWLDEEFQPLLARSPETVLLIVKPDNFKAINDTYGHDAGDKALVLLADAVKSRLQPGDIGVRYRGDEYCVIRPGKGLAEGMDTARAMLAAVKGIDLAPLTGGSSMRLTASVGVSLYPQHAAAGKPLLESGLARMLAARGAGGDRIQAEDGS